MSALTNDKVQALFTDAIQLIQSSEDEVEQLKLNLLRNMLTLYKLYTASGNSIPCLGGVGLEGAVALAERILEDEGVNLRNLHIDFRTLHKGFILE